MLSCRTGSRPAAPDPVETDAWARLVSVKKAEAASVEKVKEKKAASPLRPKDHHGPR
jgi:hypothetical protein